MEIESMLLVSYSYLFASARFSRRICESSSIPLMSARRNGAQRAPYAGSFSK